MTFFVTRRTRPARSSRLLGPQAVWACLTGSLLICLAGQALAQEGHSYRSFNASALRSDGLIGSAITTLDPGTRPVETEQPGALSAGQPAAAPNPSLTNLLLTNPGFTRLRALLGDPRMAKIDVQLRESLVAEGGALATRRDSMLPQARELDARNATIQQESEKLNADHKQHEIEKAELQRLISEHNRRCNPAPDETVYQWCLGDEAQLNPKINSYSRRVAEHNESVEAWRKKSAELRTVWDEFLKTAGGWEQAVLQLEQKILRLFEKPKTERCQYLARSTGNLCIYSCPSGIRHWLPDANDECPKPEADLPIDDGGVGAPRSFPR
jgi:hypothetical protein